MGRELRRGPGEGPTYRCDACRDTGFVLSQRKCGRWDAAPCNHTGAGGREALPGWPARVTLLTWAALDCDAARDWTRRAKPGLWLLVTGQWRRVHDAGMRVASTLRDRRSWSVRYVSAQTAPTGSTYGGAEWAAVRPGGEVLVLGDVDRRLTKPQRERVAVALSGWAERIVVVLGESPEVCGWPELRLALDAAETVEVAV